MKTAPTASIRRYRLLLRLLPRRFREAHGPEMEQLFSEMALAAGSCPPHRRAAFWVQACRDVASQALLELLAPSYPRRDTTRPQSGGPMSTLSKDLSYALRGILRQPAYALLVIVMMTLGIAGNTAVFRVFNGLFLQTLPFDDPEQLVDLDERAPQWNLEYTGVSYPDFVAWRQDNRTFSGMAAYAERSANFVAESRPERVRVVRTTHDLARVVGLEPVLGRFFTAEEDQPDGARVALLSRGFWQRQFGGDPGVLGRTFSLDSRSFEVVGVLPETADLLAEAAVWVPLQEDVDGSSGWYLTGLGRLLPGVAPAEARQDLLRIHKGLVEEREVNNVTSPVMDPLRDRYLGNMRLGASALLGAMGIVLLIACANIAGLMLARALSRNREIGIRLALGAPRSRIVRQLLTESVLLAAVGSVLGTALGVWGSSAIVTEMAEQLPAWVRFDLDLRFLGFTVLVTAGAALAFGLIPALEAVGVDVTRILHASSARSGASRARRRGMNALVVGELALALVLLIVAGLGVRDLDRLQKADPGFGAENLLTYHISLPRAKYDSGEKALAFFDQHLERLRALPGVTSVAAASALPLTGHWGWFFEVEGAPPRGPDEPNPVVLNRVVTPGYLETMGVTLRQGRGFVPGDGADEASRAVMVNETFERTFLPAGESALGKRIRANESSPWMTVVGVTKDVKHYGVDEEMRPGVYQPLRQMERGSLWIAARTAADPGALLASVRELTREMDAEIPLFRPDSMRNRLDDALWTRRASSWLIAIFSTVALVLAVAGIYGLISYSVGQRVREIGIRMALGARSGQVLGQVMRQGLTLIVAALGIGLAGTYAAARLVSGLLVSVSATDPMTYGLVTLFLAGVAALANLVPARRAARLEPMRVLRTE